MSKQPTVHFAFDETENGTRRSLITYENGDSERLIITSVGNELYRLEESAFAGDAVYGDTIRASDTGEGALLFQEIVERSPLETQSWVVSPTVFSTEGFKAILNTVMEAGGMWEQAFGGFLMVHTPPGVSEAIQAEITKSLPSQKR